MTEQPDARHAPWPQYASAVVELVMDGRHIVLTPKPHPRDVLDVLDVRDVRDATGAPETSARHARSPLARSPLARLRPPVMVLTAGDPYPEELEEVENEARMRRLCAELDAAGIEHDPALGRSPDGSTSEMSRALRGVERTHALEIAARFDQLAIYDIDEHIRCVHVATGDVVTVRAYDVQDVAAGPHEPFGAFGAFGTLGRD